MSVHSVHSVKLDEIKLPTTNDNDVELGEIKLPTTNDTNDIELGDIKLLTTNDAQNDSLQKVGKQRTIASLIKLFWDFFELKKEKKDAKHFFKSTRR